MLCTNAAIQQFVTKLWLHIGTLKDPSGSLPYGADSKAAGQVKEAVVAVIVLYVYPVSDPSVLRNLIDAAGGYEPFVMSALRYIRWFGRNIAAIPRTRAILEFLGPDFLPILATLVSGLSTSIKFIRLVSAADLTCREALILHGAPANAVTAMFQAWPTVAVMREDTPDENRVTVNASEMVEEGFNYMSLALLQSKVPILAVCQMLNAGFIELVLHAGYRCPPLACGVLMVIPRFFMYYKVLKCFQDALKETGDDTNRLQFLAARDQELRRSWSSVHRSALQILDICDKTSALPFYELLCANAEVRLGCELVSVRP